MTWTSLWRQPNIDATCRAYGTSWKFSAGPKPVNSTVNVCSGVETSRLISATLVDESTPPDRNAPTGTSAMSRFLTACLTSARTCSTASPRLAGGVHAGPSSGDQ